MKFLNTNDYTPIGPVRSVERFMIACGQLAEKDPIYLRHLDPKMLALYRKLIIEEIGELLEAYSSYMVDTESPKEKKQALADIADGCFDLIWVTIGLLLATGLPFNAIWHEGNNSNLAKIDTNTGNVTRTPDGKILKPAGWKKPDFLGIVEAHLKGLKNAKIQE